MICLDQYKKPQKSSISHYSHSIFKKMLKKSHHHTTRHYIDIHGNAHRTRTKTKKVQEIIDIHNLETLVCLFCFINGKDFLFDSYILDNWELFSFSVVVLPHCENVSRWEKICLTYSRCETFLSLKWYVNQKRSASVYNIFYYSNIFCIKTKQNYG